MDIAAYPELQERKDALHFAVGKDGIFSYSAGGPHLLTWLSIFPKQDRSSNSSRYLLDRHEHWKDPVVQSIISKAEPGRVYDIMTVPKLPTWGERESSLLGIQHMQCRLPLGKEFHKIWKMHKPSPYYSV
jgi:hypothetical protein